MSRRKKLLCLIAALTSTAWLGGAFFIPEPQLPNFITRPRFSDKQRAIERASVVCSMPAPAVGKVDSSFKYGCFCGKGHPALRHESGKPEQDLSRLEREELVNEYLKIGPIDTIDRACQMHDICWTIRSSAIAECNTEFERTLLSIWYIFHKQAGLLGANSVHASCAILAADLAMTSMFLMEATSDSRREDAVRIGVRVLGSPLLVGYFAAYGGLQAAGIYPASTERCSTRIHGLQD